MSTYTTQLRWIVEQTLDDLKLPYTEGNWPKVYKVLGLDDYPIFDEAYRPTLNNKIIRHYYTREIGAETVGRWRWFVREAMHLVMPYYNQMYMSELTAKGINPLLSHASTKDTNRTYTDDYDGQASASNVGNTRATSSTDANSNSSDIFSDTPQSEMIFDQIEAGRYATTVNLDKAHDLTVGSTTGDTTGSYTAEDSHNLDHVEDLKETESGYSTPQAELVKLYRETFLNIDRDVVEDRELAECFMGVW